MSSRLAWGTLVPRCAVRCGRAFPACKRFREKFMVCIWENRHRQYMARHRHQEFIRFLNKINRETPAGWELHLIVDNYATHKHPKVRAWLERHKRFHFHFTPTSASWLNAVEENMGADMRIAYLASQYPAASHTFIRREIDGLRARGVPVETFSVRHPTPPEYASARDRRAFQETWYLLPAKPAALLYAHTRAFLGHPSMYLRTLGLALRHRVPGVRALAWTFFYFAEAILLAHELKHRRIEHLHNHFANAGAIVGLLASHFLKLPWSFTLHGISETDYPAGLLLGAKIEAAEFVACVSHFGRAQAMRGVAPEHWHKLNIVRCAVNFAELPQRLRTGPKKQLRVVCVGRLSPEKGHLGLLEAFANIRARSIDVQLILVGHGPELQRIEKYIQAFGLQPHVLLQGILSEEKTLCEIASSDVLALASFMEGLPVVLMEAMALGVPVVAARVAGVPELVTEEQEGLLFSPSNWSELEERLARLLTDPALRERLGEAGRVKVHKQFNIRCAVDSLVERFTSAPARSLPRVGGIPGQF